MNYPRQHAKISADKLAIVQLSSGRELTYAALEQSANQSAHLLRKLGLKRGDVVATLFGNGSEVFEFAWATHRCGLFSVSISNRLSSEDIAYIINDSATDLLVVSDEYADLARTALSKLDRPIKVYTWSEAPDFKSWSLAKNSLPSSPIHGESPGSDLLYSSGTTGRPKGVRPTLPEGPLDEETPLMRMGQNLYGMSSNTRYLNCSPLYHAAPLRWAMTVHRLGGTVYTLDKFSAEECLRAIDDHRLTHATFVPTHFVRMLKLDEQLRSSFDLSSLEAIIHAAAPCPPQIKRKMIDWLGPIVHEYYSGTESCGITAIDSKEWEKHPGSVGRAVLGNVHIIDDDGRELPPGETGAVYFSDGPSFEYLNDPEKTAAAHNAKGWATLGDIGHVDAEGYLYLTDRKSFMIISGGVNIYPQEIENLLVTHPKVFDAAVFGVPDDDLGERAIAVIQPVSADILEEELADELSTFARAKLGSIKTPKEFHFSPQLPREATGKLMKRLLVTRYGT